MKRVLLDTLAVAAERTSVPLKMYLERRCTGEAVDRAGEVFFDLMVDGMADEGTALLYAAVSDGKLAFVCGGRITQRVGARFVCAAVKNLERLFSRGEYRGGVVEFLDVVSSELSCHFPRAAAAAPNDGEVRLVMGDLNEW